MPELRRNIRRLSPEEVHLADEPWWPVFLALLVFAGFASGTVLAYMSFEAEHWYANATTWLIFIGAVVLGSFVATLFLPPRTVRRSLQLAIILNVLFHLLLIVASLEFEVFGVAYKGSRPSTLRSPRRDARVAPDYPSVRINNLRERIRDNEQPVETETPVEAREITPETPTADTKEVSEEPTPNIPLPSTNKAAAEATSLPKTESTRRADTMADSGPAEAQSVRFSESSSLMSRREVEQPDKKVARPVEVIPDPGQAPSAAAKTELTARETAVARSEATVTPTSSATAPEATFPKATDSPRASDSATPNETIADAPMAERKSTTARSVDSSAAAMARSNSDTAGSESLAAQSTSTSQSEASAMPSQREVTSPSTGVAASSSRSQTPRAVASELPQSQSIADSGNLRRSSENALPSVTMAAPEASRVAGSGEATELSAAPTSSVAQQSGRESAGQLASQSTSEAPSGGADLRAATQSRANHNSTSAPAESSTGDASLPRAAIAANTARSPINAETPDISGSGTAAMGDPATPTQTSITQAQSGIAGGNSGPNLDRSAPAGSSPAILPSGMARRDAAAQASTPGEAFESSSSAVVRRSQTGAAAPSTTVRAENTPYAATEGSDRVGELNATSSAALTQASSQAGSAANAMSQGTLEVDLGPTQIVAERGEGKGSGGGGPQISDRSFDTQAQPGFASARSPGYVPSSLKADAAAGSTAITEGGSSQGQGPSAASLQASQLGGNASQSLSSLAGREAPTSPSAAGGLSSVAPGSKVSGGDSPPPSNMAESSAGSPSSRRSTSTVPSLAGVKADEVGGAASGAASESSGEPSLSAANVTAGARAAESGGGPGMQAASGPPGEAISASGGGSTGRASSSYATPSSPVVGSGPSLAMRGDSKAAPSVGLKADDIEEARNLPSDGTTDPGQGLALSPSTAQGSDVMRQGSESLPALLSAPEGVGGLGTEIGPDAGINRATALRDSTNIDDSAVRLSRNTGALAPTTVASTSVPKEAFESRGERLAGKPKAPAGGSAGAPSPETEEAIERGLAFLASIQQPDGRWSLAMPGEQTQITSDSAATALALLAFQGAGYSHREHKYKDRIASGLLFLIRNQKRNGDLFMKEDDHSNSSAALYSHALASIAVCEAYGMTQDPVLKEPAERALLYILASQSPERGGWRYVPQSSSDTSVSGWMLMALKSGQLAGIPVPDRSLDGVRRWLDYASAKDSNGSLYVYNSFANDSERQAHGKLPTPPMTAVGLLMRFYTGWNRDTASMVAGANYLRKNLPSVQDRDTYYWYYGTQVMFHMGGTYWEEWNRALHPMLIESQIKQGQLGGSWDPAYPVRDKWAAHGGRLYVTTMNLLSLEVYYRHLPLYEATAK
jgi:hypothetical protein